MKKKNEKKEIVEVGQSRQEAKVLKVIGLLTESFGSGESNILKDKINEIINHLNA